jgi:hypothetical protein
LIGLHLDIGEELARALLDLFLSLLEILDILQQDALEVLHLACLSCFLYLVQLVILEGERDELGPEFLCPDFEGGIYLVDLLLLFLFYLLQFELHRIL